MTVNNNGRVVITSDWLLDQYRGKGMTLEMVTYIMTPFMMEDTVAELDKRIAQAKEIVEEQPEMTDEAKEDYVAIWRLFKSGWQKMTVFEQEAVKKTLLTKMCERAMKGELL